MKKERKEGWQQFLQNKVDMLSSYKIAKSKESGRPIKVEHGNVAEAEFRKWLTTFLPKRYSVTSGYILTQASLDNEKITHFDTIIYNQLDCPILWIDDNPDKSDQGKSKAIPVEYVHGVIEIKSKMTSKSLVDGLSKLDELKPFLEKLDNDDEKYKMFLPKDFYSCLVFFELDTREQFNKKLLEGSIYFERGFYGSVILSAEGISENHTGIIQLLQSDTPINSTVGEGKESLINGSPMSDSVKMGDKFYSTMLLWSEVSFSIFAFDLLAFINGTYRHGFTSSFHGMGFGIQTPKIDPDSNV